MADSPTVRDRRRRLHARGDHSTCTRRCPAARLAAVDGKPGLRGPQPETPGMLAGDVPTPIRDAAFAELGKAGVADSFLGRLALSHALVLDTSSAVVGRNGLSEEFRQAMDRALAVGAERRSVSATAGLRRARRGKLEAV